MALRVRSRRREPRQQCSVEGCEREAEILDHCRPHRYRVRLYGDPLAAPRLLAPRGAGIALLRQWVDSRDRSGGCWDDWPYGVRSGGRPIVTFDGRQHSAARVVLLWENGEMPVYGCHKCDNPPCVNPAHLYAGDAQTNADDRMRRAGRLKGRAEGSIPLALPGSSVTVGRAQSSPPGGVAGGPCVKQGAS